MKSGCMINVSGEKIILEIKKKKIKLGCMINVSGENKKNFNLK